MNINYNQRRQQLLSDKQGPCAAILFSGRAPMRSADGREPYSLATGNFTEVEADGRTVTTSPSANRTTHKKRSFHTEEGRC